MMWRRFCFQFSHIGNASRFKYLDVKEAGAALPLPAFAWRGWRFRQKPTKSKAPFLSLHFRPPPGFLKRPILAIISRKFPTPVIIGIPTCFAIPWDSRFLVFILANPLFQRSLFTIILKEILVWTGLLYWWNFLELLEELFDTPFMFARAFFLFGAHFEFRNLLEGVPNSPIVLTVIQNLGRLVSTGDIIKKTL